MRFFATHQYDHVITMRYLRLCVLILFTPFIILPLYALMLTLLLLFAADDASLICLIAADAMPLRLRAIIFAALFCLLRRCRAITLLAFITPPRFRLLPLRC